jgi:hypothetical protein
MRRFWRIGPRIALLSGVLLATAPARADDDALIRQGVELRKQGRNAEALVEFQHAYAERATPRARAQIALAEQALGHWLEAEAGLLEALLHEEDLWIRRNREPIGDALRIIRDHLGSVIVEPSVDGASVVVNGDPVGQAPLPAPLRVVAGQVSVRVTAARYRNAERMVEVPSGAEVRVAIALVPEAEPAGSVPATPGPTPADVRPPPGRSLALGTIVLAASGGLLATGVVAHVIREHNAAIYNDDARCFQGDLTRDERCGEFRRTANRAEVVAIAGYAAGGATLIAGAALVLAHRASANRTSWRFSPTVGFRSAFLSCETSF